jgi:chromosome segregation ATPase
MADTPVGASDGCGTVVVNVAYLQRRVKELEAELTAAKREIQEVRDALSELVRLKRSVTSELHEWDSAWERASRSLPKSEG